MSAISAGSTQDFLISKVIQTTVNGVEVEGHSEASLYNIKTTITKPFTNISQSWHIPYFSQGHINFHGDYGERRAQSSLKDIYWVAEYVHRKEEMLKRKYQEFEARKAEVSEGRLTEGEFKLKRLAMKSQLKSGEISNGAYQRRIGVMRREVEALEKRIWWLEDNFFEAYFPMSISVSFRESVMTILDGKKSLV